MNFCSNIKLLVGLLGVVPVIGKAEPVSFKADIAPILLNQCQSCHGPKKVKGDYRVDTFERAMEVGFDELHYRITTDDEDDIMPPDADPLTADQIALFEQWKEEGEKFDGSDVSASLAEIIPGRQHPDPPESYPRAIPIIALAFTQNGESVFTSGYREIIEWSTSDGTLLRRIKGLPERIQSIAFNPGFSEVVVSGGNSGRSGEVRVLDFVSGDLIQLLHKSDDLNLSARYSPDGSLLATCGTDGTLRVFDSKTWKEEVVFANHSNWINDLAWNRDGNLIVTASRDRTAKVFDIANEKRVSSYTGHDDSVHSVKFDKSGNHVHSVGADGKLLYWRAEDSHTVKELSQQSAAIFRLGASNQDNDLVLAGKISSVVTLKAADGSELAKRSVDSPQLSLAISEDQQLQAAGDSRGFVRIYNLEQKEEIAQF
ncbi:MAG: c-type cytochrome domain-containing protein, partial [Verrucomicrobiota bacterium]